jgi:hypothetical protein
MMFRRRLEEKLEPDSWVLWIEYSPLQKNPAGERPGFSV